MYYVFPLVLVHSNGHQGQITLTWINILTQEVILHSGKTSCLHSIIKHANHMTLTTSGQIMSWPDYLKTKVNVNIKFWDLCEILIVYILLSTFQSVHMVLIVNTLDVRRLIAWIESADWNPWSCHSQVLELRAHRSDYDIMWYVLGVCGVCRMTFCGSVLIRHQTDGMISVPYFLYTQ